MSQVVGISLPGEIPEREVYSTGTPATSRLAILGFQKLGDVHVLVRGAGTSWRFGKMMVLVLVQLTPAENSKEFVSHVKIGRAGQCFRIS